MGNKGFGTLAMIVFVFLTDRSRRSGEDARRGVRSDVATRFFLLARRASAKDCIFSLFSSSSVRSMRDRDIWRKFWRASVVNSDGNGKGFSWELGPGPSWD